MKSQSLRKEESNSRLKNMGIDYNESLPYMESSIEVSLKDIDTICKKILSSFCAIQVACDIQNHNYENAVLTFGKIIDDNNIRDYLTEEEEKIFSGSYTKQNVINVVWSYETIWALLWAIGLIENHEFEIPNQICDCQKTIDIILSTKTVSLLKEKTNMRDIEDILDMLDLYYRYHWVTVEKRLHPETSAGDLLEEVVYERRKGLEWLISKEEDWNKISLDT